MAGYHPSRRPLRKIHDRTFHLDPYKDCPETSRKPISGFRDRHRGTQGCGGPPATGSSSRRSGSKNAEIAFLEGWYKLEMSQPLRTQESHPDSPMALGAHTGRSRAMGFREEGGKQRPSRSKLAIAHAERLHGTWVNALSRGAASDAPGRSGKPEPAFQSAESDISLKDRILSGHAPSSASH